MFLVERRLLRIPPDKQGLSERGCITMSHILNPEFFDSPPGTEAYESSQREGAHPHRFADLQQFVIFRHHQSGEREF
jgi:hypothetical protein